MNKPSLIATLHALALCLALPFCNMALAQADAAPNDDAIVAAVKSALAAKPELKSDTLKITSKKGEVTIAGNVDDGKQLVNIAMTAEKVPGVKAVLNEMYPKK